MNDAAKQSGGEQDALHRPNETELSDRSGSEAELRLRIQQPESTRMHNAGERFAPAIF
jgi:hypothetical protein